MNFNLHFADQSLTKQCRTYCTIVGEGQKDNHSRGRLASKSKNPESVTSSKNILEAPASSRIRKCSRY
jgi:hypothetical protein